MRRGFRIESSLELQGWKELRIDAAVPVTVVPACPADGVTMSTLCTFVSRTDQTRLRLGCCPDCGHIAYIDRPTEDWMNHYYLEAWDTHNFEARSGGRQQRLLSTQKREKRVVTLAKALNVDRRRPVCEIGSGWGLSLRHLREAGFANIIGTEASKHRADVVRRGLGVPIYTAPFESAETQQVLAAQAPFSIIVSNHVLEHTFHPDAVIAAAARLQAEGDYLIIAVPNQQAEQVATVFFFLPHLHSFTQASLQRAAARHGYAVHEAHIHPKQLLLVFRKGGEAHIAPTPIPGVFGQAVAKYTKDLELDRWHVGLRRLWWQRRGGRTGQRWMMGSGSLERARWARWMARRGYEDCRSVAVRSLSRPMTTEAESPFEMQFRGAVQLFFK